jgi:hypothetical protein
MDRSSPREGCRRQRYLGMQRRFVGKPAMAPPLILSGRPRVLKALVVKI